MTTIRRLSDHLISQIAAGEVVERPASVVKELVENALDAGSRRIDVELEEGGRRRIEVSDDGAGMTREDLVLAFERHATSKIACFEDLERVATLGFRGEALAAIAAVARVEAESASGGEATRVRIEQSELLEPEPCARPRGTKITVSSLFHNVPARRQFLKRASTEMRRVLEVVQGYSLAHPSVGFSLRNDGREVLGASPTSDDLEGLRARIGQLFGSELVQELVPIRGDAVVKGFVGSPKTTRGRRIFLFVNGRLLRDRAVLAVFYRAVRDLWHGDRFPALFLFLDVPKHEVDVNVHPQKAEVRFRDGSILGHVGSALRRTLELARGEGEALLSSVDPGSRPANFAWQGAGRHQRPGSSGVFERSPGDIAEPAPGPDKTAGATLGEVSYQPWQARGAVLSGRAGSERSLRVLAQYKGSLVLVEGPDALYLVDQHAAHERVLYEKLRQALNDDRREVQPLLVPCLLELGPAEAQGLREMIEPLAEVGFELAELSGKTFALRAIPAVLEAEEAERMLVAAAALGDSAEALESRLLDGLAADRACRGAVKIHQPLTFEKMEELVGALFEAEQPYACPHGRPTILKLDDADLERRFGRQGWRAGGITSHLREIEG